MRWVMMIAFVMLSLGLLAAPGFNAQGSASDQVASAERTITDAGATATRDVTDSWLTLQTKLALFADERVSSGDVHVTTQSGVITLRGKVDNEAEQQAAGEIARTIESPREVVAEPGEGPPAILKRQRQRYDERRGVPTLAVHCYRKRR